MTPSQYARERFEAPSARRRLRELRAVVEPMRLAASTPSLLGTPRGRGAAMVMYPGFGATDASLAPLRRFLRSRGHDARGWGLGRNDGNPARIIDECARRLLEVAGRTGDRVNLVGWSLGGVIARELARDHPDVVDRVATMATPLYGPRYTLTARAYSDDQLRAIDGEIDARASRPIERPVLAIHARNDGVVDWRSCVDTVSPNATNVEVASSHFGIGIDPAVWRELAEFFA